MRSAPSFAAPGELDPSFGVGGKARVDLGGSDAGNAVALQADGKIIVGGQTLVASDSSDGTVVRLLNPQGTLDTSYGGGFGWSRLNFDAFDNTTAVAVQADGRIVAAVTSQTPSGADSNAVVARVINPQGTFDPAFGTIGTGWTLLDFSASDRANGVALQPDGRIIIAGSSNGNGMVARLTPQGLLDGAYGAGFGWSTLDYGGVDTANAVALQPDGKIVVAGATTSAAGSDVVVARVLNPQGTFDDSFGTGGRARFGAHNDSAAALAVQPDGKIVVVGANGSTDFVVARLMPNGTLDGTFSGGGKTVVDFGGNELATAVALQPDGKILVAGQSDGGANLTLAVTRLQPSGLLDTTFGTGGRARVDFGGTDRAGGIALQPDGKVVLVGSSTINDAKDIAVARLQGDPAAAGGGSGGASGPPKCAGKPATIVGTAGKDVLVGTSRADVIVALAGNDVVRGAGGNDLVCGGPGADRLFGGLGADRLIGGPGADQLFGGRGRDWLIGGLGADRLLGGIGLDILDGGPGRDNQVQ